MTNCGKLSASNYPEGNMWPTDPRSPLYDEPDEEELEDGQTG